MLVTDAVYDWHDFYPHTSNGEDIKLSRQKIKCNKSCDKGNTEW